MTTYLANLVGMLFDLLPVLIALSVLVLIAFILDATWSNDGKW